MENAFNITKKTFKCNRLCKLFLNFFAVSCRNACRYDPDQNIECELLPTGNLPGNTLWMILQCGLQYL